MSKNIFRSLLSRWKSYRYRFVPWIAFHLKDRSLRVVPRESQDKIITDDQVEQTLLKLFTALDTTSTESTDGTSKTPLDVLMSVMGFRVDKGDSQVGGTGVYVTDGVVPKGTVLAMYPGAIYLPYEPIFFQSLSNPFIFRCIDHIHIDGNVKRLSKMLYRSCSKRDRMGPYMTCDASWLTPNLINPLALGQYVNNQSNKFPANVVYQEYNVQDDFPIHLMKYIPNVRYNSLNDSSTQLDRFIRTVVLVSTRDIQPGEEVFSTYFTMVY